MCKDAVQGCILLGGPPYEWSRTELVPADEAVGPALPHLEQAVRSAARGQVAEARAALLRIDSAAIVNWYVEHALWAGDVRARRLGRPVPKATGPRPKQRMPSPSVEATLFTADGHRCRYCGRPVIPRTVLKALHAVVGDDAFSMGKTDRTTHGAVLAYSACLDHVDPYAAGGPTEKGNLVTACYPCNFGKGSHSLEALGLDRPAPPVKDGWDGLVSALDPLQDVARAAQS